MTSTLKVFQQRMAEAVMAPLTGQGRMVRRRPDGRSMAADAAAWVKPSAQLTPFERLEIYNQQYWCRVLDSLAEDFPGLQALLGRARFRRLARAYLTECPSRSFTLRNLGCRLAPWLQAQPGWTAPWSALALDLARLEWAHIEAFDGAERPPLTGADLGEVDASTRLGLQPCLRLVRLAYPVDDLLVEVRRRSRPRDGALPALRLGRRASALRPAELHLAVHRQDCTVYYRRLAPEIFRILEALAGGAALGGAIDAGFETSALPEAERPAFLGQAFQDGSLLGWFTRPATVPPS